MKKNRKIIIVCFALILCAVVIFIATSVVIVTQKKDVEKQTFGMIDGSITSIPSNVIANKEITAKEHKQTHGDELIKFMNSICKNSNIFYFDASDERNVINSDSIINGLEWMVSNKVNYVNISLSSKFYSNELQEWINKHPEVKIYSSYNNNANSYDYPAMYDGVIASSGKSDIKIKKIDIRYKSNLIFVSSNFSFYRGNSFLSVLTMLRSK